MRRASVQLIPCGRLGLDAKVTSNWITSCLQLERRTWPTNARKRWFDSLRRPVALAVIHDPQTCTRSRNK